jgi:hypothetical protein
MNSLRRLALLAVLIAGRAQALTGNQLYTYCKAEACGGYFVGAFDSVRLAAALAGAGKGRQARTLAICPPADLSDETVVDVALSYLENHPRIRYLQAANLSLRAWSEAWPCGH